MRSALLRLPGDVAVLASALFGQCEPAIDLILARGERVGKHAPALVASFELGKLMILRIDANVSDAPTNCLWSVSSEA